jgi:tetratricopeptide (TPR) repeat protein
MLIEGTMSDSAVQLGQNIQGSGGDSQENKIRAAADALLNGHEPDNPNHRGGGLFLIGAGCSRSAGIPLGWEVAGIACATVAANLFPKDRKFYAINGDDLDQNRGLFEKALQELINTGRLENKTTLGSGYGQIFQKLLSEPKKQSEVIERALSFGKDRTNWAHICLGQLVASRYIHTVLTTNFDTLVLDGIVRCGEIPAVADSFSALNRIRSQPVHPQVVHLHGSRFAYNLRNTDKDLLNTSQDLALITAMVELIRESNAIFVVGYAGGEEGVMNLLIEAVKSAKNKTVFWVGLDPDPKNLSVKARELQSRTDNFVHIGGLTADLFFMKLMQRTGLGVPDWIQDPIEEMRKQADKIFIPKGITPEEDAGLELIREELNRFKSRLEPCKGHTAHSQYRSTEDGLQELNSVAQNAELAADARTALLAGDLDKTWHLVDGKFDQIKDASFWSVLGQNLHEAGQHSQERTKLERAVLAHQRSLELLDRTSKPLDWCNAQHNLGVALTTLGERESNSARLEQAMTAYRAALEGRTRDGVPLEWARTQDDMGKALRILGARESDNARLKEAVTAFQAALQERPRDRVPLDWAMTQNNLGNALATLGERESGTKRLEEAVTAFRDALQERTRDRVPLGWAATQNNLGNALQTLGERENGTARLEEAATAYRAALQEYTRDRVPLDWAATQNNLGTALATLGERESGTERLEEAVTAYRAALQEYTRDRVPLDWAMTQNNLGAALRTLGERESGTARLEEAVTTYRAALQERTRDRVPLYWAMTQTNLGNALQILGQRESGTARLEEAVTAYRDALEVFREGGAIYYIAGTDQNLARAEALLAERRAMAK